MRITIGQGLRIATGKSVDAADLGAFLAASSPNDVERWWSPHTWVGDKRSAAGWLSASAVCVDLDLKEHNGPKAKKMPSEPWGEAFREAWEDGRLPGSLMWLTPHGVRIVYALSEPCVDADLYRKAVEGAAAEAVEVARGLMAGEVWVENDVRAMRDLARLLWWPSTTDDHGLARRAKVWTHESEEEVLDTFDLARLVAMAPPEEPEAESPTAVPEAPPPPAGEPRSPEALADFEAARDSFNRTFNPAAIREVGYPYAEVPERRCPVCGHSGCFGPLKKGDTEEPGRWVCYSTSHKADAPHGVEVGTPMRGGAGWTGDTLDLAAFFSGTPPTALLINAGFLKPTVAPPPPPPEDGRATIFVPRPDPLHKPADEFAREVLAAMPEGRLYRFGGIVGELRREGGTLAHRALSPGAVALTSMSWAEYRDHRFGKNGEAKVVRVNPGNYEGSVIIDAAATDPKVRELAGVYSHPAVAGDAVVLRAGFNPEVGLYFDEPASLRGLTPALDLTAVKCRAWLLDFLTDFTEVLDPANLANAVGLIVTAFVRPSLVGFPVPLHAALSSMEGSGKSILCEAFVGEAVMGRPSANLHIGRDKDEAAKTLFAYARSGASCIVLDNVQGGTTLDDAHLASTVTRPTFAARVLGVSEMRELPNLFVPMLTGNNVTFSPELSRRVVPVLFTPKRALRDRTFKHEARSWVKSNRRRLAEVVLGAVERWKAAGRPAHPSGRTLRGFDEWGHMVGGIVGLLGFGEWLQGVNEWQGAEGANPLVAAMRTFAEAWWGDPMLRVKPAKASDLWALVEDDPSALGLHGHTDTARKQALGYRLKEMVGRPDLAPYHVGRGPSRNGSGTYTITKDEAPAREPGED